jgi:hypothetical protein
VLVEVSEGGGATSGDPQIDHEADEELATIKLGLDELEVSAKVRPEMPNPGSCMNLWVERK